MPFTFSHPLAVIPFRGLCPAWLNFAALVIGSMSPDFGYYTRQFPVARFAHTIPGTFAVCLPTALLALVFFCLLRPSLCFVLPQPHRAALLPLALARQSRSGRSFLVASASVLLGAWTHMVWDSFTHDGTWVVGRLSLLRAPLIRIGNTDLSASYVLQQTSTFVAGAVLILLYVRWLRRQPTADCPRVSSFSDRCRYTLLAALAAIAVAFAVPTAFRIASGFEGYMAIRVFVFRTGVYSVAAFVPLLVISSVILYAVHRKRVP